MKQLAIPLFAAASALSLTACAQSTPYAPQSASSTQGTNGYSSQRLASDRFRVMFSGNRFTDRETVENYLLYRAAELTRQQGYTGFTVVRRDTDANRTVDVDTYPAAGVGAYSTFSPYYNFYGTTGLYNAYDPFVGGAFPTRVDVDRATRYEAMAVIDMCRGAAPTGMGQTYDASQVLARLGNDIRTPGM